MVKLTQNDLDFILQQIHISERHAAGENLADMIPEPLLPWGVRTVDGSFNNFLPGSEHFGSADQPMPQLLDPEFRDGEMGTSYLDNTGAGVVDSQPRTISNLIVDQSQDNPAAAAAADSTVDFGSGIANNGDFFIPNQAPDEGLTAPFNSWMTFFGQFFDHGLDLINKGDNGSVFIPLQPDDPLFVEGSPTNFMILTRATNEVFIGPNGEEIRTQVNQTTPFVDQNQTYTSHASHQVFLREYELDGAGNPVSTGHLLDGATGGLANWAEVKAQALDMLGIALTDADVLNVPLLATDLYGKFIPGANGYAQLVMADGSLLEGTEGGVSTEGALRTGHAFLDDIAHAAVPVLVDGVPDPTAYDAALLEAHFITGDGRGNENIGLTTVHHVFHSEHNRLVEHVQDLILASGDADYIAQWQLSPGVWNGEYLFQAARFVTEMEYQHLVFEEFARTIQPAIDPFFFSNNADIDPAIVAEFAHVVYRFGHSMLTDTIDRVNMDMTEDPIGLIQAFLNPIEFNNSGVDADAAAGAIIRGMTRQTGNEIDEFVTSALRNNLLGLPLDLATINIARGRDVGVPSLNHARAQFFEASGDSQLRPYDSWVDFAQNIKNPASIINFIAAYGTHGSITAETTLAGKRDAATLLVMGGDGAPGDRVDYLNSTGSWAGMETGLNDVDFWVGGLAEENMPFGGFLGPTFNFVFEVQLENLQEGDRFYYLSRTQGLNLLNELENNSFAKLIMANTDLGSPGSSHLPGAIFQSVSHILEMNEALQIGPDPTQDDPILNALSPFVVRRDIDNDGDWDYLHYTGADHVVLGGTEEMDTLIGGKGDDTLWGDGGNDRLEGGYGVDTIHGGAGDDIITDSGDNDVIHGDDGNDVIHTGPGDLDLIFGGGGTDYIIGGPDSKEIFGGTGDDFIYAGDGPSFILGNEGDDWLEGGPRFDTLAGENSELFFNSSIIGHDVMLGGGNDTDFDGESGDDIMVQNTGISRNEGMLGFDWITHKNNPLAADSDLRLRVFETDFEDILRNRFDRVEGVSGWIHDDVLIGDDRGMVDPEGAELDAELTMVGHELTQAGVDRIDGLIDILGIRANANPTNDPDAVIFNSGENAGNIIMGGGGSDIITGKGANDIIDGDAWLNVRIAVSGVDGLTSIESLKDIESRMFSGEINPGQLSIVREILNGGQVGDIDTAVYSDVMASYDIVENPADLSWTVTHARGTLLDGSDLLRNIERLQFSDVTMDLVSGNLLASGTPEVNDTTPTEGQELTAGLGSLVDLNGTNNSTFSYQWQVGSGLTFVNIAGAVGATFTPTQDQVGQQLRVVVSFSDDVGFLETVASVPTGVVGDLYSGSALGDIVSLTLGNDIARGFAGDDQLLGSGGDDWLSGANGNDSLHGQGGNDVLLGGAGTDTLYGDDGDDLLNGHGGDDQLAGGAGNDTLYGGGNNDTLGGNAGDDLLYGQGGNDVLFGGVGNDFLAGNAGDDQLQGGLGNDSLYGGHGNDLMAGNAGDDMLYGGQGNDNLYGGDGSDFMTGQGGDDLLVGGLGNDALYGAAGNDTLNGQEGDDVLDGGTGNDLLIGAAGNDTFAFSQANFGLDTIQDFTSGQDLMDISALGVTSANFASQVVITDGGVDAIVTIGGSSITLVGVTAVVEADFILAA
ncbi:heme peroxidase [Zobellella endophytica]|uniref:Heme peroxidase n=1 Tax=Zobellella endophytica TaxID=2116700 RepID=A0A2P7R4I0_9GAMM|nr:peroxidase family protein [Zobellella endophytica]PSJ45132.1 heme peroxidase [Zobellella endophytica]